VAALTIRSHQQGEDSLVHRRAQTFKVEKFDIKGDGGTDYVAVEANASDESADVRVFGQ
jgi:hypothetical protein